jgi:hypothetical protein
MESYGGTSCQSASRSSNVEGDEDMVVDDDGSSIVGIPVGAATVGVGVGVDETMRSLSSLLSSSQARRALGDTVVVIVVVVAGVLLIIVTTDGSGLGAFRVEGRSSNRLGIQLLGSKERNNVGCADALGATTTTEEDGAVVVGPKDGILLAYDAAVVVGIIMEGTLDGRMVATTEAGQDVLPRAFAVGQG